MRNGDSDTDASPLVTPKVSSRPPRSSDSKAASIALGAPVASTATAKVWLSSASATLAAPTALAASRRNALRSTTVSEGGCSVEQLQQEQAQRPAASARLLIRRSAGPCPHRTGAYARCRS